MNTEENLDIVADDSTEENGDFNPIIPSIGPHNSLTEIPQEIIVSQTLDQTKELNFHQEELGSQIGELEIKKAQLEAEIKTLVQEKNQLLESHTFELQKKLNQMVESSLTELEQKKQQLQTAVEKLERRKEKIEAEMRTTFAGVSQDLAIRLQGFKDYLVGSLQDLAVAAEQLELPSNENWQNPTPQKSLEPEIKTPQPQFSEQNFAQEKRKIKEKLEQYRTRPDYYGAPWQLRRTFEPIHAERVKNWFFAQGGRGAIKSMGSRLQNILVASAIMSVLHQLYGNRVRSLVLANTPERLGEWRRGLQDCLGISRSDFGPERGVVLFEQPEALIQKADRLVEDKLLPLVIIDETEDNISLSLLQFPLWLAFAPEAQANSNYYY